MRYGRAAEAALRRIEQSAGGRIAIAAVLGVAALHAARYRPHFSDDAFIALRYAERFAAGRGLTFNDGEWVEGYSDLLWVLALGALAALGVDGVVAARALGLAGMAAAVVAVGVAPRRAGSGGLALALCGGLAGWAVGGLEHAAVAGLAVWAARGLRDGSSWVGALAAPLVWLRADGLVLAWALALVFRRPRFAAIALGAAVAQLGLRLALYGDWLPGPARVKVSLTASRTLAGLEWVAEAVMHNGVLVAAACVAAALTPRARPPLLAATLWAAYVAAVGGDHFNGYRQLVPILPLLALAVADGAEVRWRRWWLLVGPLHGAAHLDLEPVAALSRPGWSLAALEPAHTLRRAMSTRDPLLAVDAAGALPYGTGFRTIDMLGLTDAHLARSRPPGWGEGGRIGHDTGDGAYLAARRPDLVAFCHGHGAHRPCFPGGRAWAAMDDFDAYRPVWLATSTGPARYLVRVDGAVGVERRGAGVWIPALLLSTEEAPAVEAAGRLRVHLRAGQRVPLPAGVPGEPTPPGLQRVGDTLVVDQEVELDGLELTPSTVTPR